MKFVNPDHVNLRSGKLGAANRVHVRPQRCTICGDCKQNNKDQAWFLMTQNRGEDKLNIWKWNRQTAGRASVHSLCSPRHVRELVVHWMATGCLHYPFASGPSPLPGRKQNAASGVQANDKSTLAPYQLGEIAVDPAALVHVLRENALSLNILLDELMVALESEVAEDGQSELEDETPFSLLTM